MPLAPPFATGVEDAILATLAAEIAPAGGLTFCVDDGAVTYSAVGGQIAVEEGVETGATAVRLSQRAWGDLVGQWQTCIGLFLSDELQFQRGGFDGLAEWEPALRYVHAGIPPYDPSRADLQGRDPFASFPVATDDAELRAQLSTMGYLHVTGVFGAEEMEAANLEVDRLASLARRGDDESWWVSNDDDTSALCRLVYASQRSELFAAMERDPRIERLGTLLDPALAIAPDRMEGASILLKVPGETRGLSNIPWHQDCGTGGHAIFCPAVAVGIQLTGSSSETGNLQVVPGSHGQTLRSNWHRRMSDVPVVSIDTAPGDVTVHIQDLMHASPKPTGDGHRRTMYVTHYPERLWDHIGPGEALNDLVRNRTEQVARLGEREPTPPDAR